ncbi:hypothetical protein MUK42_21521 [Musa troglodytarum]|uniref:Uncharacterized protein n=1 Tax=Musa troglodytarum TaxID=320322 RepID=A0A9E7JZ81_9LILI|nr:hypothetical protein MUK42_21521 [Musa troglodytarum]
MAGGGKRGVASSLLLVTLLVTLSAYFATNSSAARVTPRPQSLARVRWGQGKMNRAAYAPVLSFTHLLGSCPSACTNCVCVLNECTCVGHVDYKACEADTCAVLDAAPKVEPSQQWAIEETGGKLATMV